jgi:hypothetical protein
MDSDGSNSYPKNVAVAAFRRKALISKTRSTVTESNVMKGEWYWESISNYFYTIKPTAAVCYAKLKAAVKFNGVATRLWTRNKKNYTRVHW